MVKAVKDNIEEIMDTCRKMQVKSLYLFGSGAREKDFSSESDLDFVFQFTKNNDGHPILKYDYFDLLFKLQEITGKKVDLVAEEKISNKYFKERVEREKIKIYES